jgi:hypothetical protein
MALPVGAYDDDARTLVSSPQTACCASSAKSAICHGCTPKTLETQPVEPQAPAMSLTQL